MNVRIRKMTLDDIPVVVQLDQISFSLPWPERSFRYELTDNPASRCWVAEVDGHVVGMIVGWLLVDEMHIATIATHPGYRRQGIASKLLTHTLLQSMQEGARSSFLEVRRATSPLDRLGYDSRRIAVPDTCLQTVDATGAIVARTTNLGDFQLPLDEDVLQAASNGEPWTDIVTIDNGRLFVFNQPIVLRGQHRRDAAGALAG